MMAAEASLSKSVDAATTSTEPIITISADSQDVDPSQPRVNGAASSDEIGGKQLSDIVDDLVNSAEVSVSGGSDTEASKPDGAASKDGDKAHSRTSSAVRKPATFKSVSVNRTFLGSKAPTVGGPTSKSLDKPSSASSLSTQQSASGASSAARPRLVAKLGVSRDGSRGSVGAGGKAAGAPDPSAVWNKNRPPPPPEPKKFTDEELKKYGIHMTDRLAPGNDAAGQNNWADIDDDDEDWAGGEIQWNDGTKVTIPQVDEPQESPKPAPAIPAQNTTTTSTTTASLKDKVLDKPKSPAPSASPSTKPGIGVLGSGKGLVLKGAPEKPTLVARPPPPPAPIKSPWATLPPVEKAPLDNATPHSLGRPPVRDGPPTKSMTPPPAKEIAADDFSRSGGPINHNRELYNSQSGRYEPVADRRGAPRNDVYQRHPASVLQRPSQGEGPAEPSPAFQTNRPGPPEPPYGRRRGSSNVSGGSGTFMQRPNKPYDQMMPPPDLANVRRGSLASDSPVSPRNFSPSGPRYGPHGPSWHARTSPHISNAVPHHGPGPQDPATMVPPPNQYPQRPLEDEYELQKKLMAEKLQLARQRKAEEEAKAEAEKQKRIAARLAAMGPAPESRSAKQAAAREVAASSAAAAPPAPSSTHSPPSQTQATSQDGKPTESKVSSTRQTSDGDGANASIDQPSNGPRRLPANENSRSGHPLAGGDGRPSATQDGKQPSWQGSAAAHNESRQSESRFSWGPSPGQTSTRSLWAAPNSNRSLGNGTFVSDLGRVPETFTPHPNQMPSATAPGPGPIGPPGPAKQQQPVHPKPIAPPKVAPPAPSNQRSGAPDADVRSQWAKAAMASDEKSAGDARDRFAQQKLDIETRGVKIEDVRPTYADSWKPVQLDSDGRRVESKTRVSVVHGATWRPAPAEDGAEAKPSAGGATPPSSNTAGSSAAPSLQTRGSRFFPSKDSRPDGAAHPEAGQRGSPSPPPPDMDGHPAFDGDAEHPHVALPPSRPVVRLPPSMAVQRSAAPALAPPPATSSTVNSGSSFSWATPKPFQENPASPTHARGNPTPTVQRPASSWQTKIHDLLHDTKTSPSRAAVDSTSRGVMDSSATHNQATVSLPGFAGSTAVDQGSPTSKDMAEECFEEQEMGSLPPVRLPASVPDAAWHPAVAPGRGYPKKLCISATTVEAVDDPQPNFAFVLIPGMPRSKRVHLPSSMRSYSNPSRPNRGPRNPGPRQNSGAGRGGPGGGGAGGNGPRPRDTPMTSYTTDGGAMPPSSSSAHGGHPTSTGRGGRGFRRSADWGRRAPTPVQT